MHPAAVLCIIAALAALASAVCTPGYEPSSPFPVCPYRRIDAANLMFAISTGGLRNGTYAGTCVALSSFDSVWQSNLATSGIRMAQGPISACGNATHVCYDTFTSFDCGCMGDCDVLSIAMFGLVQWVFVADVTV